MNKYFFIFVSLILVISAGSVTYYYSNSSSKEVVKFLNQELKVYSSNTLNSVTPAIRNLLLTGNIRGARNILESWKENGAFSGYIIFQNNEALESNLKDLKRPSETYLKIKIPIYYSKQGQNWGHIEYFVNSSRLNEITTHIKKGFDYSFFFISISILLIIFIMFLLILYSTEKLKILFEQYLKESESKVSSPLLQIFWGPLIKVIDDISQKAYAWRKQSLKAEKIYEKEKVYKQVAHDIKSPLATLEIVMDDLRDLPADSRELTINAISRIQDIANNLSRKHHPTKDGNKACLISKEVISVINEKKIEFRNNKKLQFYFIDETNQMEFASINNTKLTRIISNLINNSAQAMNFIGLIKIILSKKGEHLVLKILDNGPGFPDSILAQPIKRGNTIGKKDGQGLGLYHAYESLSEVSGDIELKNQNGAIVTISIPKQNPPQWFCSSINFPSKIVICDDDKSIHDLWKKKLSSLNCEITHFYSADEFNNFRIKDNQLILMDFNLRSNKSGLDLVKEADLDNVIFVTSDFENIELQAYCINKHLKILPKYLISVI